MFEAPGDWRLATGATVTERAGVRILRTGGGFSRLALRRHFYGYIFGAHSALSHLKVTRRPRPRSDDASKTLARAGNAIPRRFTESPVTSADGRGETTRRQSRFVFLRFASAGARVRAAATSEPDRFFRSTRVSSLATRWTFTAAPPVEGSPLEASTANSSRDRRSRSRIGPRIASAFTFAPLRVISMTPSSTSSTATARVASISARHRSEPPPHTARGASLGHMDLPQPRARSTDKMTSRRRWGSCVGKGRRRRER